MISRFLTGSLMVSALLLTPALAEDETYKFNLQNDSQYTITGFETFEDSKWSTWKVPDIEPGQMAEMDWKSSEGECNVPFRIIYKDVETEQYDVDWCEISNIRVEDDKVTAN